MRWSLAWTLVGIALGVGIVLLTGVRGQEATGCRDGEFSSECRTYRVHTPRTPVQLATGGLVGGIVVTALASPFRPGE